MDYLLTDVKIFTLLTGWFQQRNEIKEWLLALAAASQPKRRHRIAVAEWYLLHTQTPPVVIRHQKETETENQPSETDRMIMISLDSSTAPLQYRTISTTKRVRFQEDVEGGKRHHS